MLEVILELISIGKRTDYTLEDPIRVMPLCYIFGLYFKHYYRSVNVVKQNTWKANSILLIPMEPATISEQTHKKLVQLEHCIHMLHYF